MLWAIIKLRALDILLGAVYYKDCFFGAVGWWMRFWLFHIVNMFHPYGGSVSMQYFAVNATTVSTRFGAQTYSLYNISFEIDMLYDRSENVEQIARALKWYNTNKLKIINYATNKEFLFDLETKKDLTNDMDIMFDNLWLHMDAMTN